MWISWISLSHTTSFCIKQWSGGGRRCSSECWKWFIINSHIIYKERAVSQGEQPPNHIAYRRNLIEVLSLPQCQACRVTIERWPSQPSVECLQATKHFLQKTKKRKDWFAVTDVQGVCNIWHCTSVLHAAATHLFILLHVLTPHTKKYITSYCVMFIYEKGHVRTCT